MGLECFRHEKKDDGYVNVDVINSNLRSSEFKWWFKNYNIFEEGPFNGINVDTTYDNTNRRIAILEDD